MIILIIHIIVSYDQNILLIYWWIPCQASTSVSCLHYRPVTVHCSTKDAYTSEITFLALNPWICTYFRVQLVKTKSSFIFVVSIDPSCKDGNVRFTKVPLKAFSNHVWIIDIHVYVSFNCLFLFAVTLLLWPVMEKLWKLKYYSESGKRRYFPHF